MIVVFVEITGNGPKEALVFKGPRRISDEVDQFALKTSGPIQTFGPNAILLGVGDYDNDGAEEMYIGETEKQVVEIWGPGE